MNLWEIRFLCTFFMEFFIILFGWPVASSICLFVPLPFSFSLHHSLSEWMTNVLLQLQHVIQTKWNFFIITFKMEIFQSISLIIVNVNWYVLMKGVIYAHTHALKLTDWCIKNWNMEQSYTYSNIIWTNYMNKIMFANFFPFSLPLSLSLTLTRHVCIHSELQNYEKSEPPMKWHVKENVIYEVWVFFARA